MRNENFTDHVRNLVKRKYALDAYLAGKGPCPDEFAKSWPNDWNPAWNSIDPFTFVKAVIPFWNRQERECCEGVSLSFFDASKVIGNSWREWPGDKSPAQIDRCLAATGAQVSAFIDSGVWNTSVPAWGFIGAHPTCAELIPFGLVVANEGKNRAALYALYQKMVGYEVFERVLFPNPSRLKLRDNGSVWEVILDERESQELTYCSDILVPMLRQYGVQITTKALAPTHADDIVKSGVENEGWLVSLFRKWTGNT